MRAMQGIPRGAALAIDDMLDNCALIRPGQEVLILAQIDGLYGGDNLVDEDPHFVAPGRRDFRLKADSPVYALGFQPIPVEKIGLYRDGYRRFLPIAR